MKKVGILAVLLALGLLVGVTRSTPARAFARNSATIAQQEQAPPSSEDKQEAQTFTGKIAQVDGHYVLQDMSSNTNYKLDNEDKAKQFDGKNVKVIGTLDSSSNTIHVSDIEPS
ncbi:MAG: hypothetical protein LAP13_13985 [Acidobacteriia bacterium]|nr:hypothetical protein [Terriglobia bacterium]